MDLRSNVPELDELFANELVAGRIFEWGLPQGQNGRIVPLAFLRGAIPPTVWIYPQLGFDIYPPSWASQGIDLNRIFFVRSDEPLKQLRPLFLEDTFKILVIDSPQKFSKGDLSFVAQKVRENKQLLFLIRNHFLSPRFGNPFARMRVNCSQNARGGYTLQWIKGGALKRMDLSAGRVFCV